MKKITNLSIFLKGDLGKKKVNKVFATYDVKSKKASKTNCVFELKEISNVSVGELKSTILDEIKEREGVQSE